MRVHATRRPAAPILLLLALAAPAPAQEFLLTRTTGRQVAGKLVGLRGKGVEQRLVFDAGETRLEVPCTEILGLQGPAPMVKAAVAVHLVGGAELKGEIEGGDADGNNLLLKSSVLGVVDVPVDRVATIVFRNRVVDLERLRIQPEDSFEEALFLEAGRGLDVLGGGLARFDKRGVYFSLAGEKDKEQLFRWSSLIGVASRVGYPPKEKGSWSLITTDGDRLRGELGSVARLDLTVATEFGALQVPLTRIAALTYLGGRRQFLSDLEPARVAESGSDSKLEGGAFYGWRRDRTVSGGVLLDRRSPADGFLVAGGFTYDKGIGVHSKSLLTFRVPEGMTRFHARVGIDDEVKSLGVKGDADVLVRAGDKTLFEATGLRRGQEPKDLGVLRVEPGALLTLEVQWGKGLFLGDRVDWLSAVFLE